MKFDFQRLVDAKLVNKKTYPNGLSIFKYSKRVFFDALWNTDPLLLEARGMVLDSEGNTVIWPFTKVFNHGENGAKCKPNTRVQVIEKINGFLGVAVVYKGELIVSTTGTLASKYADMAREHIEQLYTARLMEGYTYLFEICDERDPHIVTEEFGAYLIGMRQMESGFMVDEIDLDYFSGRIGAKRPVWKYMRFAEAVETNKTCTQEGFMIRDLQGKTIMKMKSPHYLTKKALMRLGDKKIDNVFKSPLEFRNKLDEEFYECFDEILEQGEVFWKSKTEGERRAWLEAYFTCSI